MIRPTSTNGKIQAFEKKTKTSQFFQFILKINLLPAGVEERKLRFSLFSRQVLCYLVIILLVVAVPNFLQALLMG